MPSMYFSNLPITLLTPKNLMLPDPNQRLTLAMVAEHPWVIGEDGPLPEFSCWCKRTNVQPNSHHEDAEVPSQSLQET